MVYFVRFASPLKSFNVVCGLCIEYDQCDWDVKNIDDDDDDGEWRCVRLLTMTDGGVRRRHLY